jgi:hypothetical protein
LCSASSVDHFRVLQEGPAGGLNMPAGGPADGVRPCEIRRVPAGVPAGRQRLLQVDRGYCRRVLQVVSGSCRRVPGGKNSRAKVIIKILYVLFYLRCQ